MPVDPQGMVEGVVEDPYRLDVLERRKILTAEDQDLVAPERLAQSLSRGLVNELGQVHAFDLGADQRAGGRIVRVLARISVT
jgi:hypothetical protein